MGREFKTYEKKSTRLCGDCAKRMPLTGYCLKEMYVVRATDPCDDCKHYEPCQKGGGGK